MLENDFSSTGQYLQSPSDLFFEISTLQILIYAEFFAKKLYIKNIKNEIVNKCIETTQSKYPDWFDMSNPCYEHRLKVLDFLVLVLLRKNCLWIIKAQTDKTPSQRKLRILKQ